MCKYERKVGTMGRKKPEDTSQSLSWGWLHGVLVKQSPGCKLLYIEWISNKVLLYNTGNYILYLVINTIEKNLSIYLSIYIYLSISESLCYTPESKSVNRSVVFNSLQPHGLQPTRLCPWNSPVKNTGVGCHSLLQWIFPTQGSNPGLLHCRPIFFTV